LVCVLLSGCNHVIAKKPVPFTRALISSFAAH
jgi:hypothetical protein